MRIILELRLGRRRLTETKAAIHIRSRHGRLLRRIVLRALRWLRWVIETARSKKSTHLISPIEPRSRDGIIAAPDAGNVVYKCIRENVVVLRVRLALLLRVSFLDLR